MRHNTTHNCKTARGKARTGADRWGLDEIS